VGKYVRGGKLEEKIADGIKKLVAEAKEANRKYVYNASQLSVAIKVSRPTLAKHADVIEKALKTAAAEKRMERGEGAIQLMREKMERMESENESLKKEVEVLRNHHAEIYLKVYYHAADLEPLIRPIVEEEMFDADRCILCFHPIEEIGEEEPITPKPRKVIELRPTGGDGRKID